MISDEYKHLISPRELERIQKIAENEARKKRLQNPKFFEQIPSEKTYVLGLMEAMAVARVKK